MSDYWKRIFIYGGIPALIMLIINSLCWMMDPLFMFRHLGLAMVLGFGLPVLFMILGGLAERRAQDGYLPYGQALKTTFLIGVVFWVAANLVSPVYYNVVNPTFFDDHKEELIVIQKDLGAKTAELLGASEADMLEQEEKMSIQLEAQFEKTMSQYTTFTGVLLNLLGSVFLSLFLALIVSLIVKRNPPQEQMLASTE